MSSSGVGGGAAMDTAAAAQLDPILTEQRILELCAVNPEGINDVILQHGMPQVSSQQRLAALNRLLSLGKLDVLKSAQLGIVYRLKDTLEASASSLINNNMDEKLVYAVIKESGNKGIWIRDISIKTNVRSTALNKTLKNLETKKLIKSVASVNANKKKVYMLFDLEPDRSITGGAWYSGKEFESEFVEILNEQCYHYLCEKKTAQMSAGGERGGAGNSTMATSSSSSSSSSSLLADDPVMKRNATFATTKEIRDYIRNLGISKVDLNVEDIETILNTLVYDGKIERTVMAAGLSLAAGAKSGAGGGGATSSEHISLYRAVDSVLDARNGSGLVRVPCGICPLIDDCHPGGSIEPQKCVYMKEWLEY